MLLLSLVSKLTIGDFELAAGASFAGVAALVILWPLLRQIASKGGSAEVLGVKLQVNALERETEENWGVKIEALRSDLEDLRRHVAVRALSPSLAASHSVATTPDLKLDITSFEQAVAEYKVNEDDEAWRNRTKIDQRLLGGVGRLPVAFLRKRLSERSESPEVAMAVAVCLGLAFPGDDDKEAAKALAELLRSNSERVRYRAARSIELRARRADTSIDAKKTLSNGLRDALKAEYAPPIKEALRNASAAL